MTEDADESLRSISGFAASSAWSHASATRCVRSRYLSRAYRLRERKPPAASRKSVESAMSHALAADAARARIPSLAIR